MDGGAGMSAGIATRVLKLIQQGAPLQTAISTETFDLTKREIEIMKLFAAGFSNKEIADKLSISSRTVESHKNHIMQKMNFRSPVDMVKYAIKNNYIDL